MSIHLVSNGCRAYRYCRLDLRSKRAGYRDAAQSAQVTKDQVNYVAKSFEKPSLR